MEKKEEAAHGGSAIPWRPAGPGEQAHPQALPYPF